MRIFDNENCLRLTFKVFSRAFFKSIKKKSDLIFKGQELFIFPQLIGLRLYPSTPYRPLDDKHGKMNMDVVPCLIRKTLAKKIELFCNWNLKVEDGKVLLVSRESTPAFWWQLPIVVINLKVLEFSKEKDLTIFSFPA